MGNQQKSLDVYKAKAWRIWLVCITHIKICFVIYVTTIMVNPNVFSSLLLAIPSYVASQDPRTYDVAIMSVACTITSVLNHSMRQSQTLNLIDKTLVRATGIYYCIKAVYNCKNIYHALTLWWGAFSAYLYTTRPSYYFQPIVHLCSMMGMLCYIKAETI